MNDYDQLAPFYDAVMGDRSDVVAIINRTLERYRPDNPRVLELGCGTGEILASLAPSYEPYGIDQSAGMLAVAATKLPLAVLHQGTIAGFDLNRRFGTVFCVFDTINHLKAFRDWQKTFTSTFHHLDNGGLFIFDMNTVGRMQALAGMPPLVQDFGRNTMEMIIEAVSPNEVSWYVTVQETQADGVIQVHEENVHETSFPIARVNAALRAAGFDILETFDSDGNPPTDSSDRIYYVCHKPL